MTNEENEVNLANQLFYKAFERLDIKEMESIWARRSYIECVHPGWRPLRGPEAVMASWRRIFENTKEIRFMLTEVAIRIRGSFAWVTLYENITSAVEEETVSAVVATTNIFEASPEGWRLVHHHASPVPQHPAQVNPSTVH